jgi:hypothetical protein
METGIQEVGLVWCGVVWCGVAGLKKNISNWAYQKRLLTTPETTACVPNVALKQRKERWAAKAVRQRDQ